MNLTEKPNFTAGSKSKIQGDNTKQPAKNYGKGKPHPQGKD